MKSLGKLSRLDPRDVWKHEAHEFTPWLLVNIGELAEALGIDLEDATAEVAVGDFAVDIEARTSGPDARPVIIENQLEQTDHSHLGQLITYAAGRDAAIIVWISTRVREEHRSAIDWLNSISGDGIDFFAVEVEALQIDTSVPAAHFKVVAQPNAWSKQTKKIGSNVASERGLRYQHFFEEVLATFKAARPGLTSASKPGAHSWLGFTAGRSGFSFNWSFGTKGFAVELYIDTGDKEGNKALFYALQARADELEALDEGLSWERLDSRRACRVATYRPVPSSPPLDENPDLASWAVRRPARLRSHDDVMVWVIRTGG